MTDKEREQDKQLVANLEQETSEQANEIERLHNVLRKSRHYVRAVFELAQEFANQPYILHEIDAALEQPSAEPVRAFAQAVLHGDDELEKLMNENARLREDKRQALDVCERLLAEKAALAQSDAELGKGDFARYADEYNYELAIAQAIEGPRNSVSTTSKWSLEELRAQKWSMISEGERKKRLWQARAVIDLIKARPDAPAELIDAAKELERQACRESHFHRAEAFNEAARIVRARAADRSGK